MFHRSCTQKKRQTPLSTQRSALKHCRSMSQSRAIELGTREDGSGLLERLNLLIAAGLTDLEVLHDEVAAGVQLTVAIFQAG